jgi:hypothetical protein
MLVLIKLTVDIASSCYQPLTPLLSSSPVVVVVFVVVVVVVVVFVVFVVVHSGGQRVPFSCISEH